MWGQHGHKNTRQDLQDTIKPGHGHNYRKICTRPDNQNHPTSDRHQQYLNITSQEPDGNKHASERIWWTSTETEGANSYKE